MPCRHIKGQKKRSFWAMPLLLYEFESLGGEERREELSSPHWKFEKKPRVTATGVLESEGAKKNCPRRFGVRRKQEELPPGGLKDEDSKRGTPNRGHSQPGALPTVPFAAIGFYLFW